MGKELVSGTLAGLAIFAAGFMLGIVQTLGLLPRMSEWQAVLIEGPFILTLTWFILSHIVKKRDIPASAGTRLAFGATALVTLWVCEWIMTMTLMDEGPGFFFRSLATAPGATGLAGQLLIIVMPLWMKAPGQNKRA